MARSARIVAPGLPHHVVLKGVAGRSLFADDFDRRLFLRFLALALRKFGARCLGWCLVGNHLHLIIVPEREPLARVMHYVAGVYGQKFNWRCARVGHLFQNRYWSKVIRGDDYLVNAVAYVHLNAVKAGFVPDLSALQTYRWSGYSALMGVRNDRVTDVAGVLSLFSPDVAAARRALHEVMTARLETWARNPSWTWGDPPDAEPGAAGAIDVRSLVMERSASVSAGHESSDERRLRATRLQAEGWTLDAAVVAVCRAAGVAPGELVSRSRRPAVSRARSLVSFLATDTLLLTAAEVGRTLRVNESSVRRAARVGARLAARDGVSVESLARVAAPAP